MHRPQLGNQAAQSPDPRPREIGESDPELSHRVRVEIFRQFGCFPAESSEHSAEYVPWFMHQEEEIDRFHIPVGE